MKRQNLLSRVFSYLLLVALLPGQALGMDINGPLKKATLESLSADPSTTTAARIYFNNLTNTAKIYNGTAWGSLGGSGSGQKNYVTGPSSAAGWTASGAGVTATTVSTGLPDASIGTGLKVLGVSGSTAFAYTNFTLDAADVSKKLQVSWDQAPVSGYVSNDFKVDVYSCTVAWSGGACSGTMLRLPLSTDSSAISAIPNLTGTYRTTFDTGTALFHQVQIGLNGTNTHSMVFAQIVVGPGVSVQGANVGPWLSYTPTVANFVGTLTGKYRIFGDSVQVRIFGKCSGAVTGTLGDPSLPNSYTLNNQALPGAAGQHVNVGVVEAWQNTGSGARTGLVVNIIGTGLRSYGDNGATLWNATAPFTWANNDEISYDFTVPVNELAGSGTVNLGQNSVEYAASTNGTWDAAGSAANTVYGTAGAPITGSLTAVRQKIVRFQSPVQVTDKLTLLFQPTGYAGSVDAVVWAPYIGTSAFNFGVRIVGISGTDVTVEFEQFKTQGSTFNSSTGATNWNSVDGAWVLTKASAGQAVSFGAYVPGQSSGLVPSAGLPGVTTNTAACTGCVGEIIGSSVALGAATSLTSNVAKTITSIILTPGDWDLKGSIAFDSQPSTTFSSFIAAVSGTTNTQPSTTTIANPNSTTGEYTTQLPYPSTTVTSEVALPIPNYQVLVASGSTLTLYLVARTTFAVSTATGYGYIQARRMH